jgi:tRNA U34 5-carboxymethylaminomethyl modifying GTPase MnmE/TrmE
VDGAIDMDGVPVRLIDTAGQDEPRSGIETERMRRARSAMEDSGLGPMVVDGASASAWAGSRSHQAWNTPSLLIKSIRPRHPDWASIEGVRPSELTGEGLDELQKRALSVWLETRLDAEEGGLAATARQIASLDMRSPESPTRASWRWKRASRPRPS